MLEKKAIVFHNYLNIKGITPYSIRKFRNILYWHYKSNARHDMPWRHTDDPYEILVSEIMLQQTQVERVLKKYPLFIARYPDFSSLARTPVRSLYKAWQGMGYNRRALALRDIARKVLTAPYKGRLPDNPEELMKFPSIGQSTAGALAAFAFNKPAVFIETNIRRVFIYFFFHSQKKVSDHEIIPLIKRTLDPKDPRNWYYALMDLGSSLRTITKNPNKRSAHYTVQSPFHGSNRQMRGSVLRLLSTYSRLTTSQIGKHLRIPQDKVIQIIRELSNEGFLRKKGPYIRMG